MPIGPEDAHDPCAATPQRPCCTSGGNQPGYWCCWFVSLGDDVAVVHQPSNVGVCVVCAGCKAVAGHGVDESRPRSKGQHSVGRAVSQRGVQGDEYFFDRPVGCGVGDVEYIDDSCVKSLL